MSKGIRFLLLIAFSLGMVRCAFLEEAFEPMDSPATTTSTSTEARSPSSREINLRKDIINYAMKLEGTKYKAAGRDPRSGFDCSGFTRYVMNHFDIKLSASSRDQVNDGATVALSRVQAGDLVFFRRSKRDPIFHVGLVVSNDRQGLKIIHSTSCGVVVDNVSNSKYWQPKLDAARTVVNSRR